MSCQLPDGLRTQTKVCVPAWPVSAAPARCTQRHRLLREILLKSRLMSSQHQRGAGRAADRRYRPEAKGDLFLLPCRPLRGRAASRCQPLRASGGVHDKLNGRLFSLLQRPGRTGGHRVVKPRGSRANPSGRCVAYLGSRSRERPANNANPQQQQQQLLLHQRPRKLQRREGCQNRICGRPANPLQPQLPHRNLLVLLQRHLPSRGLTLFFSSLSHRRPRHRASRTRELPW